jgi:FMN reductase
MKIAIVEAGPALTSKSRILAHAFAGIVEATFPEVEPSWIDFVKAPLPVYTGPQTWEDPAVIATAGTLEAAAAVVICTPIYNFSLPASVKSLLELTGDAWTGKVVGFLCNAGGTRSYMAPLGFANSLMLDYRCLILPRFVYATSDAFADSEVSDAEIRERLELFTFELVVLARAYSASQGK